MPKTVAKDIKQVPIVAPEYFWQEIEGFVKLRGFHNISEFFEVAIHQILSSKDLGRINQEHALSLAKEAQEILQHNIKTKDEDSYPSNELRRIFNRALNFFGPYDSTALQDAIGFKLERLRQNLPILDEYNLILGSDDELLPELDDYDDEEDES
ncbi:MAG: hypothetical protein WCI62_05410 [Erysipelotrichaceae bacterium]